MNYQYWSFILTLVGASCMYFAGKKYWWAWFIGIFAQTLWLAYALQTKQYGFVLSVFIYGSVYISNARRWMKER